MAPQSATSADIDLVMPIINDCPHLKSFFVSDFKGIADPSATYRDQVAAWQIIEDVISGEPAIKAAGAMKTYLPKKDKEDEEFYKMRFQGACWWPFTERAWSVLAARPFTRPVVCAGAGSDAIPANTQAVIDNVNLQGYPIHDFAYETFKVFLKYGWCAILVDWSKEPTSTLRDQKAIAARPYGVLIEPRNLLGSITGVVSGVPELLQVRMLEIGEGLNSESLWETLPVRKVRVFDLIHGSYTQDFMRAFFTDAPAIPIQENRAVVFRSFREQRVENQSSIWIEDMSERGVMIDTTGQPLRKIPLVTMYAKKSGTFAAQPPLYQLAKLNLNHYQDWSEQRICERYIRVPIRVVIGADEANLVLGADRILFLPQGSSLEIVQGSEKAGEFGQKALHDLEEKMQLVALDLLAPGNPGNVTATQKVIEASKEDSELGAYVHSVERGLEEMLSFVNDWYGIEDAEAVTVSIHTDFNWSPEQAKNLNPLEMWKSGALSLPTLLGIAQRYDVIGDDVDIKDEMERISVEQGTMQENQPFQV